MAGTQLEKVVGMGTNSREMVVLLDVIMARYRAHLYTCNCTQEAEAQTTRWAPSDPGIYNEAMFQLPFPLPPKKLSRQDSATTKPYNLNYIPGPAWWKERTDSCKLFSDLPYIS